MQVIICGSRGAVDLEYFIGRILKILKPIKRPIIATIVRDGKTPRVERLAREWAFRLGLDSRIYRADYDGNGTEIEMLDESDALIAFWDGSHDLCRRMIRRARKRKLQVRVIRKWKSKSTN